MATFRLHRPTRPPRQNPQPLLNSCSRFRHFQSSTQSHRILRQQSPQQQNRSQRLSRINRLRLTTKITTALSNPATPLAVPTTMKNTTLRRRRRSRQVRIRSLNHNNPFRSHPPLTLTTTQIRVINRQSVLVTPSKRFKRQSLEPNSPK